MHEHLRSKWKTTDDRDVHTVDIHPIFQHHTFVYVPLPPPLLWICARLCQFMPKRTSRIWEKSLAIIFPSDLSDARGEHCIYIARKMLSLTREKKCPLEETSARARRLFNEQRNFSNKARASTRYDGASDRPRIWVLF